MEDNFEHEVKIVTETVFYQSARPVTNNDGKNAIAWLYKTEDEIGIPFIYKAMSMDHFMKDHFVFFAIDAPT